MLTMEIIDVSVGVGVAVGIGVISASGVNGADVSGDGKMGWKLTCPRLKSYRWS